MKSPFTTTLLARIRFQPITRLEMESFNDLTRPDSFVARRQVSRRGAFLSSIIATLCNSTLLFLLETDEYESSSHPCMSAVDRVVPKRWITINGTSVTHSCSPSLHANTDNVPIQPSMRQLPSRHEEFQFLAQGDYWSIGYQRHVAFLKASRGIYYIGLLLANPGREFHVSELVWRAMERRSPLTGGRHGTVLQNG